MHRMPAKAAFTVHAGHADHAGPARLPSSSRRGWFVLASAASALAVLSTACGGGTPAPTTPPADQAAPDAGASPEQAATDPKIEEQHQTFVKSCTSKTASSGEYCECAWTETRKNLGDDELMGGRPDVAKLERVRTQISSVCSAKLPEEAVKQGFTAGCTGERADMQGYCDCSWTEYRKNFSAAELASDDIVKNDRFLAARKSVVTTCAAQMPESVAKDDFMSGCARDPKAGAFCSCAWTELRKMASAGEIEAGTFDKQAYAAKTDKACGKLKPTDGDAKSTTKTTSAPVTTGTKSTSGTGKTTPSTGKSTSGKSTTGTGNKKK